MPIKPEKIEAYRYWYVVNTSALDLNEGPFSTLNEALQVKEILSKPEYTLNGITYINDTGWDKEQGCLEVDCDIITTYQLCHSVQEWLEYHNNFYLEE